MTSLNYLTIKALPMTNSVPKHLKQYVDYINNTGGITPDQFDDDWKPIGMMVRNDMLAAGLILPEADITVNIVLRSDLKE